MLPAMRGDIIDILESDSTEVFVANDIAVVVTVSLDNAEQEMQRKLNSLVLWAHDKGQLINADKTKVIHIRSPHFESRELELTTHIHDCIRHT